MFVMLVQIRNSVQVNQLMYLTKWAAGVSY